MSTRSPRRSGDEYEKYIPATEPDARRVSGSGSSPHKKGDVKLGEKYLIQAKRTDKLSFTVKLTDLKKAEHEAMNQGRAPLFRIGFWQTDRVTDEWVLMPKWLFDREVGNGRSRDRGGIPADVGDDVLD